jgi:hypothetical protein
LTTPKKIAMGGLRRPARVISKEFSRTWELIEALKTLLKHPKGARRLSPELGLPISEAMNKGLE